MYNIYYIYPFRENTVTLACNGRTGRDIEPYHGVARKKIKNRAF